MNFRNLTNKFFLLLLTVFFIVDVSANDDVNNYDVIANKVFWQRLYAFGGWSLYCGYRFESDKKTSNNKLMNIEHIFPPSWMLEQANCSSRMECRESNNEDFLKMEADMHNMYPVWQPIITYSYNKSFGEVQGEEWRIEDCDLEWVSDIVEPRPVARGNIARAMFYMKTQYGVAIEPELLETLKRWNREDPPSPQEKARNDRIEKIQGHRNPYIDDPALVDQIFLGVN